MALLGKWFGFGREEIFDQALESFDHGDWEGAIERFEVCLEGASDPTVIRLARFHLAESYAQLGLYYLSADDMPDAIRNLATAIEIAPNFPDFYIALSRAYAGTGDQERRRKALEKALELNERSVDTVLEWGVLLYETESREEGLKWIERAVASEPAFGNHAHEVGCQAHADGDPQRAAAAFAGIASGDADPGSLHLRLAKNYHRERMFQEAANEYRIAAAHLPRYADLHCQFGQALVALGELDEAIDQFREAIRLNPRYVQAHACLGAALIRARKVDLAIAELKEALQLDPDNEIALREVQRLRTA